MNITEALSEYLEVGRLKMLSSDTLYTDMSVIGTLNRWLASQGVVDVESVDKNHLRSYMIKLSESKVKKISINSYMNTIQRFLEWCVDNGYIENNPYKGIRKMETDKPLPSYVPIKDMEKLFEGFETSTTLAVTQIVMFEFFYATGIRTNELINLEILDVDLKNGIVRILHGKGGKQRNVPLPAGVIPVLKRYLQIREQQHFSSPYMFPNAHGEKMHRVDAYNYMKQILKQTPSKKNGAHTIRHSYATHLLGRGANIKAIGDLLGHNSVTTTQIYAHLENEEKKKIYDKAHPKA